MIQEEINMILGFSLAVIIGLSLGLMGGGGSILTVPILVYALDMDPKTAIALSLAIVGLTSLVGSVSHMRANNIHLKIAAIFGPIAMAGTFLGAKISVYLTGAMQLIIFAVVMLIASYFMFTKNKNQKEELDEKEELDKKQATEKENLNIPLIMAEGIFVGILTGIVGVGGGFMIVPALVLLTKIPMKKAIGTSLLIISFKSFAGFAGYLGQVTIPWTFLIQFSFFTIIGILIGSHLVQYVSSQKLKRSFAVFLVIMGFFILYKNASVFI
ncbi:MAG: putative membrane protein YfcA [Bacteriovoracaceae bacterium]|jgi:uncharacterized membrane protein YfcA